jgi:hypothetical protein
VGAERRVERVGREAAEGAGDGVALAGRQLPDAPDEGGSLAEVQGREMRALTGDGRCVLA